MKSPNLPPLRFRLLLLAALLAPFPFVATAQAQSTAYVFTKIIDDQTTRPDGLGDFYIGSVDAFPSLDGNTVLFQDITNGANSLWNAGALGGGQGLVKIADFQTAVPGGVGTFTRFDDQTARVQDGVILFEGLDSNTAVQTHGGLYTAPAGGALTNTADVTGAVPDADTTNNTATSIVTASDVPTVTIADSGDGEADEGGAAGKAVVRRTGDLSSALTVRYKTKGSAKAGTDFKALSGIVTIPAGAAQTKVKIKPIDNQTVDGTRKAKIMLLPSLDGSYQLGSPDLAKIKIIDND